MLWPWDVGAARNGGVTRFQRPSASEAIAPLVDIAIALTSEVDLDRLLERIVAGARRFTNAEAGTLFLREGETLRFAVCRTIGWRRGWARRRCVAG